MAPRPHRCDHRRGQQGRHDVVVRVAVDASRRRAVVRSRRRGSSSPRATASRSRRPPSGTPTSPMPATGRCTSKRRRRTSTAARPSPRRCATRLVDPHALVVLREPVSRAISFFTYQKIRLRFPADYSDHRVPRGRRPAHRRRLRRSREREVHGVPRRVLRRLPARLARRARRRPRARHRLRRGSSATRSPRCTRPPPGSASIPRDSPPTRSAPRTAPPGTRARASSGSRSPATTGSSACCAAIPSSSASSARSTTASTGVPPRSPSPTRCAPSSRRATRSRTRRLAQQLDAAGIPLPGWLSPSDRAFRRQRRRVVAPLRRRFVGRA